MVSRYSYMLIQCQVFHESFSNRNPQTYVHRHVRTYYESTNPPVFPFNLLQFPTSHIQAEDILQTILALTARETRQNDCLKHQAHSLSSRKTPQTSSITLQLSGPMSSYHEEPQLDCLKETAPDEKQTVLCHDCSGADAA